MQTNEKVKTNEERILASHFIEKFPVSHSKCKIYNSRFPIWSAERIGKADNSIYNSSAYDRLRARVRL